MDYEQRRNRMVEDLRRRGAIERDSTAAALLAVPRHEFVPEPRRDRAYQDRPLPIGEGQTISAPHMVGRMVDLLGVEAGDTVLEIGTGCGYHAAVTSAVVGPGNVYSVEYHDELAASALDRFDRLDYDIAVRVGDGHDGWAEHAPYDAAYLTCAARSLPDAVVDQTREGGVVLAPLGSARQTLERVTVGADGLDRETHGGVRFVPMQGDG